jgi:enoyl-CoA hydratase/carnithine racemase
MTRSVTRALAREIAGKNPDAVRAAKRLLVGASRRGAAEVLQAESDEQKRLMGSFNQLEAVRSRLEKRAPKFRPR